MPKRKQEIMKVKINGVPVDIPMPMWKDLQELCRRLPGITIEDQLSQAALEFLKREEVQNGMPPPGPELASQLDDIECELDHKFLMGEFRALAARVAAQAQARGKTATLTDPATSADTHKPVGP